MRSLRGKGSARCTYRRAQFFETPDALIDQVTAALQATKKSTMKPKKPGTRMNGKGFPLLAWSR